MYRTRNFVLSSHGIQSNKEHLWMIKYWSEVEVFNLLQNSFNANTPGNIDIIDIICEGNIFIQSLSWKFNFLLLWEFVVVRLSPFPAQISSNTWSVYVHIREEFEWLLKIPQSQIYYHLFSMTGEMHNR